MYKITCEDNEIYWRQSNHPVIMTKDSSLEKKGFLVVQPVRMSA